MKRGLLAAGLAAASVLAAQAGAQTITPIVQSGDAIPGVGNVVGVIGMAIDDSGNALAHAFTDNSGAPVAIVDASHNALLVAGQSVSQPPGATIADFSGGMFDVSASGNPAFWIGLNGTSGGAGVDDQGLYSGFAPDLGVQMGITPCTAAGVTPFTIYRGLFAPRVNDSNVICFSTLMDDPTVPGSFDTPAVAKVNVTTHAQSLVAKKNDVLPGQTFACLTFGDEVAFNNAGQTVFSSGTAGPAGLNTVVYLDGTKLAQTGDNAPWPGNPHYLNLGTSTLALALSGTGHTGFSCQLNSPAGTFGIVHDGGAFVLTGDMFPELQPFKIGGIGHPLYLADDDRMLWLGTYTVTGSTNVNALYLDYTPLVQEGVTRIGGALVTNLAQFAPGFFLSKNGRYVGFQATLETGVAGAYLIDIGG